MPAREVRRMQDAVHGLMEFRGLETSVLDVLRARELQRLRRIRQLGLAHLVFPAAEHSRLVHVIGAAHLAVRFGQRLHEYTRDLLAAGIRADQEARRDLALAALCHDLGHGPLSHAWEREVLFNVDRAAWIESLGLDRAQGALQRMRWHELVTQALLRWPDGDLHGILEAQEEGMSARIAAMLTGEHYVPYLPRLLNSDIDVDRCDFIIRDAIQTGVAYGRYDLNWLISTAAIGRFEDRLVVGFDERKAPRVIEQLLIARRALYDTVYQHKTIRAAEVMVGLLLRRIRDLLDAGKDPGLGERFEPYRRVLQGEALTPAEVLKLDDYSLWVLINHIAEQESGDATAIDLARRIVGRRLFKEVRISDKALDDALSPDGMDHIRKTIGAASIVVGEARYYAEEDHDSLELFSDDPGHAVYLIDTSRDGVGSALLASHDDQLKHLVEKADRRRRLFVAPEAVEIVYRTVGP